MSTAVVSTSAAPGRPFVFDAETGTSTCHPERDGKGAKRISHKVEGPLFISTGDARLAAVTPASRLEIRPAPEMASSGIPALDALAGGLPRGCLTEICGPASSGRTTVLLAALAAATRRGEYCALVDASDALDPHSIAAAGVELDRLLWVRCGKSSPQRHRVTENTKSKNSQSGRPILAVPFAARAYPEPVEGVGIFNSGHTNSRAPEHSLEQVLRATDLLLESGGFGLIALDLADLPPQAARRIPLTTWFRFRRAIEYKPTILLAIEQQPIAGSCSSLLLQLGVLSSRFSVLSANRNFAQPDTRDVHPAHAELLTNLEIQAELIRSRLERKPTQSVTFTAKTAWAG